MSDQTRENTQRYLLDWCARYRSALCNDIMPFWLKYGLDREHGGVYTCVDRDGTRMDTTKSVWFQGRFGFVAAFAYNHIEKNPDWLAASKSCIDFIEAHCFDTDGHMYFEVTADGIGLRKRRYIFSEAFAAIAMSEYSIASGDRSYAEKALELFKRMQRFLQTPGFLPSKYEPVFQAQGHSITMILVNTASCIVEPFRTPITGCTDRPSHRPFAGLLHASRVQGAPGDRVGPNEGFIKCPEQTGPSICIWFETAWFLLEEAKYRNWDKDLTRMALTLPSLTIRSRKKYGQDEEYGGLLNFRELQGSPTRTIPRI